MQGMADSSPLYIGLMSGTSLDGVDGVLASFVQDADDCTGSANPAPPIAMLASAYIPFSDGLRADLMALQANGPDEIHREALAANALARCYAECTAQLLAQAGRAPSDIRAVGVHGQTVRHRPELGYTRQINNPALLAELSAIDVIADFRSRDIAAGGQGAPLVPAFHQAIFSHADEVRVVANIGGIANISVLDRGRSVTGFDAGPGNVLMDEWIGRHHGKPYDADGAWAATGQVIPALLKSLLDEPFLTQPPPKSTGRDLFHAEWLRDKLAGHANAAPADVQATLTAFTARTISQAIATYATAAAAVYVCGGGAWNGYLMRLLQDELGKAGCAARVQSTDVLGVSPNHVEALAFAWLAMRHVARSPGNLPGVTGARGPRILGALYPA
jgi:anhydro-N-acetylmuramic acid kinase